MKRLLARVLATTATTVTLAVTAVACGSSGDGASDAPNGSVRQTSTGEQIARSNGCAGCHGGEFDGAAGPTWIGLAGSEVELVDGTTVTADDAYLTRAIADPSADVVAGFTLKMPANTLSDAEIADIVAYINSLADG